MTLRRCIADGNWIKAPKLRTVGGVKVLRWSDRDVERVHRLMKSLKLSGPAYIGTMPFKVFEQLFRHRSQITASNLSRKIWRTRGRRLAKLASQPCVSVLMQCT